MAKPNDSITITPGAGAAVATHIVDQKEYQVFMQAGEDGHIIGSKPIYVLPIPSQVHVNAANTVHWDIFNGTQDKIVRVVSIRQIPDITIAVTGIAFSWKLARTTAIGTGGSAITAWLPDTEQSALDADITCRSKPTGGATEGTILITYPLHSEESNAGTIIIASMGGLQLVPNGLSTSNKESGIVLRPGEGLRCVQINASAAGNTGWQIVFTVE